VLASVISQFTHTETQKRAHYYIFALLELNQPPFHGFDLPTDFIQQVYDNLCLYLNFTHHKNNQHKKLQLKYHKTWLKTVRNSVILYGMLKEQ